MTNFIKNKYFIFSIVALILLGTSFYFLSKRQSSEKDPLEKVLAVVGNKKITQRDYNERAFASTSQGTPEDPEGVDEYIRDSILQGLIRVAVIEKLAQERNKDIEVQDNEIIKDAQERFEEFSDSANDQFKAAYKKVSFNFLFEQKFKSQIITWKEGKALLCRYDRSLQVDMNPDSSEGLALREKQKSYAKTFCDGIKDRLSKKASTYEQEKAKLLADPTIGEKSWEPWTMTFALEFGKNDFGEKGFVVGSNLRDKILEATEPLSGPVVVDVLKNEDTGEKIDGLYAVILIDQEGQRGEVINFEDWIENTIQEMKNKREIKLISGDYQI